MEEIREKLKVLVGVNKKRGGVGKNEAIEGVERWENKEIKRKQNNWQKVKKQGRNGGSMCWGFKKKKKGW